MLTINQLSYSIGERQLFHDLTFTIPPNEKVGLIGVNGTGKTTLLNIITGHLSADSGDISTPRDYVIDYLPQTIDFEPGQSIKDYILQGDLPVVKTLLAYEEQLLHMQEHTGPEDSQKLVSLQESMDRLGGWDLDKTIKTVLTQLNIHDLSLPISSLSGGQRKRVALAAALLRPSDLLILDEPTNHLDELTIQWLEDFLIQRKQSVLLVTHDRYFLDRVTNRILELDHGSIYSYPGNYSTFVEKKAERLTLASAKEQKRNNLYRKELAWMRQGAQARSTKQKARIDRFHELEDETFVTDTQQVKLLSGYTRLGRKTIELEQVTMGYGDLTLFKDFSYLVQPGDRIGIIGPNGSGKTTLLQVITQAITPLAGSVDIGPTVKISHYRQHFELPDETMTLIDYIRETAEYVTNEDGYQVSASVMLERFLFDKTSHYSPIAKLSGGEKRRLYLLKILMEAPNVLILDEPTNDLDIDTLKALEDYLDEFIGIVLVVSHDRYFLDRVCEKLFILRKNHADIDIVTGNYSEYIDKYGALHLEGATSAVAGISSSSNKGNKGDALPIKEKESKAENSATSESDNNNSNTVRKMTYKEKTEFNELPKTIAALEKKLDELETTIATHQSDYTILGESMEQKDALELELLEAMERLEFLSTLRQ